jgi:adhesin transport system outer membrane protein
MKKILILGALPFVLSSAVSALTINEALVDMINTNPEVHERIENYRAVEKDKTIAKSGYLPVIDIQAATGKKRYYGDLPGYEKDSWRYTEAFIRARQNLFQGFGTQNNVEQQDERLVSAEYYLMEKVSQLGLEMIDRYLEIIKAKKLLNLAIENREVHRRYYSKIKERTGSGAGTQGDLEQVSGRLALAKSNVSVAENNLLDAETNFLRIYGKLVRASELRESNVNRNLVPATLEKAEELAECQYPSILAMKKNVDALEAGYRQAKETYYPKVDLELKRTYYNNHDDGLLAGPHYAGHVNETSAMVIASWNLYNGGADVAAREKAGIRMLEESNRMLNVKRLVSERLRLSWAAKERLAQQVHFLKQHRDYTKKTLDAYNEEFNLGRRTLLDVLDVENEFYTSRKEYVSALYDAKLANYRVIENVGNLPKMISVTSDDVLNQKLAETEDNK